MAEGESDESWELFLRGKCFAASSGLLPFGWVAIVLPSFRIIFLSTFFLALCLAGAPARSQDSQSKNSDSINGTVVNSVTHEPIGRALVSSSDNRFATMTDGEGHFEFVLPPAVPVQPNNSSGSVILVGGQLGQTNRPGTLMARKPGYLTDENSQLNLQSGSSAKNVTISLVPEALIVGHVSLPTSEPPDRLQVEIYRRQVVNGRAQWISVGVTTTKSDGEFRFSELGAGTYKLFTHELLDNDPQTFSPGGQPYGYAPAYFPNFTDFASAGTILLSAGKTITADLSLVRQPYYPVKVAVSNATQGMYFNVIVSAQGHKGPGYVLGYNEQEQRIEGMLPNGVYTLEVSGGFGAQIARGLLSINVHGVALEGLSMTLIQSAPIDVRVKEEFTLPYTNSSFLNNGRQRFALQGPRSYLNVGLEPADEFGQNQSYWLRPPTGPEDERLVIDNVQPGRYWVQINPSRGYASSVTSGGVDLRREPLVVSSGGSTSPIEITMRDDSAEIDGDIEGTKASLGQPENNPSSSSAAASPDFETMAARIYCVPLADSDGQVAEAGVSDERFTLQGLTPGVYRVLAFKRPPSDLEYRNPEAMQAYDGKGQVVRLVAGQKEHVSVHLISQAE